MVMHMPWMLFANPTTTIMILKHNQNFFAHENVVNSG
jgi:hypothetical protein